MVKQMSSTSWAATELHSRDSTRPGTGPGMGPVRGLRKSSGLRVLTGPGLQYMRSPEFKFRFGFFCLQMLSFSALSGPNEQKFGELLT